MLPQQMLLPPPLQLPCCPLLRIAVTSQHLSQGATQVKHLDKETNGYQIRLAGVPYDKATIKGVFGIFRCRFNDYSFSSPSLSLMSLINPSPTSLSLSLPPSLSRFFSLPLSHSQGWGQPLGARSKTPAMKQRQRGHALEPGKKWYVLISDPVEGRVECLGMMREHVNRLQWLTFAWV